MFYRTENFLVVVSAPPNIPKRREDTNLRPLPDLNAFFRLDLRSRATALEMQLACIHTLVGRFVLNPSGPVSAYVPMSALSAGPPGFQHLFGDPRSSRP